MKLLICRGVCPPTFQASSPHVPNERRFAGVFPVAATNQLAGWYLAEVPILALQRCHSGYLALQISRDFGKLGEGGLEIFDDFGGDDVGVGRLAQSSRVSSFKL